MTHVATLVKFFWRRPVSNSAFACLDLSGAIKQTYMNEHKYEVKTVGL